MTLSLKLDAAQVNALLRGAFPDGSDAHFPKVTEVAPGRAVLVRAYHDSMLRPGRLISGPNLMSLADTAAYALVLAHIGDQLMAVTSSLVMNFLRGFSPATCTPRPSCSGSADAARSATLGSGPNIPNGWRPRPPSPTLSPDPPRAESHDRHPRQTARPH